MAKGNRKSVVFEIKDGTDGYRIIGTAKRIPRDHSGWQSVTYRGKRYQLYGGIYTPLFINISNPLSNRKMPDVVAVSGPGMVFHETVPEDVMLSAISDRLNDNRREA